MAQTHDTKHIALKTWHETRGIKQIAMKTWHKHMSQSHDTRHMAQTYGTNTWHKTVPQSHGTNIWRKHMAQTYGANTWHKHVPQSHGTNIWHKLSGEYLVVFGTEQEFCVLWQFQTIGRTKERDLPLQANRDEHIEVYFLAKLFIRIYK